LINDLTDDIDMKYKAKKAKRDELNPEAASKKEEHVNNIKLLLDRKVEIYAAHDVLWDKYLDQQHTINQIEHITKIQKRLHRDKKRREFEEEEDRIRKELLDEKRKNPWKHEIAVCNDLLVYCKLLLP